MENLNRPTSAHYVERANQFREGMNLLAYDLQTYGASVGLLAIHSAISLNDAVMTGATGSRSRGEDHRAAAKDLERICAQMKIADAQGLQHFRWLLSTKSAMAYGEHRISERDLKLAISKARRFSDWAFRNFKGVLHGQEAQ